MSAPVVPLLNQPEQFTYNLGAVPDQMGGHIIFLQVKDGAVMTPTIVFNVTDAREVGKQLLAMCDGVEQKLKGLTFDQACQAKGYTMGWMSKEDAPRYQLDVHLVSSFLMPVLKDLNDWKIEAVNISVQRDGKVSRVTLMLVLAIARRMAQGLIALADKCSRSVKLIGDA